MPKNVPYHGNPETKVFGNTGTVIGTNTGKVYLKSASDTLNVGWEELYTTTTTTTTTAAPTTTTTAAVTTTTAAVTTTTAAVTTTTAAVTTTTAAVTTTTAAVTTTTAAVTTTTAAVTTTTAAVTTTTEAPPVPFTLGIVSGQSYSNCSATNALIAGINADGSMTATVTLNFGRTATPSDPIYLTGTNATWIGVPPRTSGTSYSTTVSISAGADTFGGYDATTVGTTMGIVVGKISGGNFNQASIRGRTSPGNAVAANIQTTTGQYLYNIRNMTTATDYSALGPFTGNSPSVVTNTYYNTNSISIIEFLDYPSGTPTSLTASPDTSCDGTTTTAAATTTTAAVTTTTAAVTTTTAEGTTTTAEGTTTTAEGTTTTAEGTTTTAEGTTTTAEGTTTTAEGTTTTAEGTTTTGAPTTTTSAPVCYYYQNNTLDTYFGSVNLCGGGFGSDTIAPGATSTYCLSSPPVGSWSTNGPPCT